MRPALTLILAILATPLLAPARAADTGAASAQQLATLFMQSCLKYAGDRDGLRGWAKQIGLKELSAEDQDRFLYGLPGVVFDASNDDGRFRLVSEDGGSCSVLAASASGPAVLKDLEQSLQDAQITFKVTAERPDAIEKTLQHREYVAQQGKRAWLLLVSIVQDPAGGEAMLTANAY
jgi:hypothetical protein